MPSAHHLVVKSVFIELWHRKMYNNKIIFHSVSIMELISVFFVPVMLVFTCLALFLNRRDYVRHE